MSKNDDLVDRVLSDLDIDLENEDPVEAMKVMKDLIAGLNLRIEGLEEDLK